MKTFAILYLVVAISLALLLVSFFLPQPQKPILPAAISKSTAVSIKPPEVEVILAGDVMLGRTVETKSAGLGDYAYPFREIGERLKEADIVFINLENSIIENCPVHTSGFKFCSSPKMLEGLSFSGVDIVSLANNHAGNYEQKGLEETRNLLTQKGIATTGLGELVILKREDTLFGFLGFDLTARNLREKDIALISQSNSKVDILIVGVHWGAEYTQTPTDIQRIWAKEMISSGADVIAGHHSHWVQSSEIIEGKPVYYSLGNLIFDQMWSERTKKGEVVELTFKDGQLESSTERQTYMSSWGQPSFSEAYLGD